MAWASLLKRPSSVVAWGLIILFFVIGILGSKGIVSDTIINNSMDMMMWMGMGLAMAVIMSYAGYVSFGHTVFVGLGGFAAAYIVGVLNRQEIIEIVTRMREAGVPANQIKIPLSMTITLIVESVILASILAVAVAALVGYAVLRLRGAFFAIATIGVNYVAMYMVLYVINNTGPFKRVAEEMWLASLGDEVPLPKTGLGPKDFYWIFFAMFVITVLVAYLVRVSKLGYGLSAIREDEDAAEVVGVDTFRYKLIAFIIAGWLASLWGVARVFRTSFSVAEEFSLLNSVVMILENSIGGIGTFIGPIIGSLIYYPLRWYTQTLAAQAAFVVMGIIIVIVVTFFPDGIAGVLRRRIPRLRKYIE